MLVCRSKLLERGGTVVVVEDITDWRVMEERVARRSVWPQSDAWLQGWLTRFEIRWRRYLARFR